MSAELIGILTVGVAIIAVVAVLFQRLDSRIDLLESRLEKRLDQLETGMVDIRERLVRGETKVDSLERWAFQGMPEPQTAPPASQAAKSSYKNIRSDR